MINFVRKSKTVLNMILGGFKSEIKKYSIKREKHINIQEIVKDLRKLGIKQGDTILLHSSLRSIGFVEGGAKTVIKAILNILGSEGTLCIPTYSMIGTMYNTCIKEDYVFDSQKSHTALGAIPSAFLKLKGIHRSIHPTHSISCIGKYAKEITENHHIGNKSFGENSPWAKIIELKGKIFGLGISLGPTTQYHYVEDLMGDDFPIKVKVDDIFKVRCKNNQNEFFNVLVQPLDPNVSKTRIDRKESYFLQNYFWEIYEKLEILNVGKIGGALSWWANMHEFVDILFKLAKLKITIYSTEVYLKNHNLYPFELIKIRLK